MSAQTLLKVLLQQRHLQGHRAFAREYDRVARSTDKSLVGGYPSKAQFYRWISGELSGLPYADHCMILEKMFPGRSAVELFSPSVEGEPGPPTDSLETVDPIAPPGASETLDVSRVFVNRADFVHHVPPGTLFDHAHGIRSCGLSLNLVCQQYPDQKLGDLLNRGANMQCLFLDPESEWTRQREIEESQPAGQLAALTRLNMDVLRRLRSKLDTDARERLEVRIYDAPVRFNITLIDDRLCVAQPYMPCLRGVEAPTLILERGLAENGLYNIFENTFTELWNKGTLAWP